MQLGAILAIASVTLATCNALTNPATCPNGVRPRYDWDDMSTEYQQKFINAIRTLHTTTD